MKKYEDEGIKLFLEEYNCAQSVFAALADKIGFNKEDALAIAAPFGGGIARSRKTCGALTGALMAIGYKNRHLNKAEIYEISRAYMNDFEDLFNSTECRVLLNFIEDDSIIPSPRTKEYYEERPCVHIVHKAIELVEKYLK